MRRAFHALRNGYPGPVHVEMTADVCAREVDFDALAYRPPTSVLQSPESGAIEAAAKALLQAKKPVLWAGAGVLFLDIVDVEFVIGTTLRAQGERVYAQRDPSPRNGYARDRG